MKVYVHGKPELLKQHLLLVQPGTDHPEVSSWLDEKKKPLMISVVFQHGVAQVDDSLGQYLIDKGYAKKSKIIIKK